MKRLMPGAEPFFFQGGKTGCLMIHGFTGTPFEMREMGEYLAAKGHTVLGPRLAAHATRQEDMLRSRWWDWMASVEDGYHVLRGACDRIVPMGLSMGGLLTLLAAAHFEVAGAVPMSTPVNPPDARMKPLQPVAPLLTLFWRFASKSPGDWHDAEAQATHLEYSHNPVRAGAEVYKLILEVQRNLRSVTCPLLIVHSRNDRSVPPTDAEKLRSLVGSSDKEILWLEDSGHVVTRDAERRRLFESAAAFVRHVSGDGP
jgi:carboxylesterase